MGDLLSFDHNVVIIRNLAGLVYMFKVVSVKDDLMSDFLVPML